MDRFRIYNLQITKNMNKKELSQFKQFSQVDEGDLLFGKSQTGGEFGFFPASLLGNEGYAAVRFNLEESSPVGERCGNLEYVRQLPSLLGLGCDLVGDDHSRSADAVLSGALA